MLIIIVGRYQTKVIICNKLKKRLFRVQFTFFNKVQLMCIVSNIKSAMVHDKKICVQFRFDLKVYFNITLQYLFQSTAICRTNTNRFFFLLIIYSLS